MTFRELGLSAPILRALKEQGYAAPSPIQEKAIPPALSGRDVLGCAQTGTGKTCAFATPILHRLSEAHHPTRAIRALVLTPTRELAIQIGESVQAYSKYLNLRHAVIFGGVGQNPQVEAIRRGIDILVATPGRLMDLYQQGLISLEQLEIFVLDEADRMLDMGFIHDVKKILTWLPRQKQTLFFSATMPPEITNLVNSLLHQPVKVAVDPVSSPVEAITQWVYLVDKGNKTALLAHLMEAKQVKNALVFTRTKHGANKVARDLAKYNISAAAIHGNKSQTARQQALSDFKAGRIRALVATDIAARGLDIEELSHVFNYNLPEVPETYVHRIGRTGRAGRGGEAIALCDFGEKPLLRDIEKLMKKTIPVVSEHPYPMQIFDAPKRDKNGKIINEEDAEARAAAREKRRQRAQAGQPARQPGQSAADPANAQEQPAGKKPRRRRRKAVPPSDVQQAIPSPAAEQPVASTHSAPPKRGVRAGKLMDTGDSMPRTEFHRPNPLDSDVIMDATARLLAPRRPASCAHSGLTRAEKSSPHRTKKPAASSNAEQPQSKALSASSQPSREVQPVRRAKSVGKKPPKAAASMQPGSKPQTAASAPQKKTDTVKRPRRDRPRPMQQELRRSQTKDSTEQPSLMKPYYLDIGR